MRKYLITITILAMASCQPKPLKQITDNKDSLSSTSQKKIAESKSYESLDFAKTDKIPTDTSEYILIDRTMAVMIMPDTTWINQQQKEMGEEGWNEVVSDNQYYQSEAMDSLDKVGIESKFYNSTKRFYQFIKKDRSIYCVDKQKMRDKWGLILFGKDKNPVFWSSTSINDAIKDIYNK